MANLVSPGYNRSSLISEVLSPFEERTIEFKGLNRKHSVEEGEMSDMKNLTSDNYPLLTPRKLRGTHPLPDGVKKPISIMTKFDRIAMIAQKTDNSIAFFYDGAEVPSVTGLTEDTEMVAINTKICFFPQKTYLSLERGSDSVTIGSFGHFDATKTVTNGAVSINSKNTKMNVGVGHGFAKGDAVDIEGTLTYDQSKVHTSNGSKAPICTQSDRSGGDIKVRSGVKYVGIQKEGKKDLWVVCVSQERDFTFEQYFHNGDVLEVMYHSFYKDGVHYAWTRWYSPTPKPLIECYTIQSGADPVTMGIRIITGTDVKVSSKVDDVTSTEILLPKQALIGQSDIKDTSLTFTGTVKRESPDIKHVIEWNNRLWGVNDEDNTVYACKLGDPTNWKYYQGTSLDSYYAQQGTDGKWTGCAGYSAHLIFFKQNSMTKIYGTSPSSFQVNNTICYGVEEGSSKSVVVLNDVVLYKSTEGIMAYEGGTPYSISNKLNADFHNVVAGTEGRKYYASIENMDGSHELLVLDVERAVWHKEDDVRFRSCCTHDGRLYFVSAVKTDAFDADKIYIINPETTTETKKQREWMAVFGDFDENVEGKKIFSKLSIRFIAQPGTVVTIYIRMDDGGWERIKQFGFTKTGGETIPIVPRRCDRFAIKIVGKGDCEIKSLTRRYRRGSEK